MATRTVIPIREFASYREPMLEEILSDPITRAVMRADRVDPTKLRAMLTRIADVNRRHGRDVGALPLPGGERVGVRGAELSR